MMMKTILMAGAVLAMPVSALAQAAPAAADASAGSIAAGTTVKDPNGGTVGKIDSVDGDFATVATAKNKVRLPKSAFAVRDGGAVIGMTADQLDQAAAQAAPATPVKADVAQGKAVTDMQGGTVGTIAGVDAQVATLQLSSGTKVRLPVTAFGAGANGTLRIAMSAAQLSAAASAAGAGAAPAAGGAPSSGGSN